MKQPVIFIPHGGGPWPFVDLGGFITPGEKESLAAHLRAIAGELPERPKALLVVSAHWETTIPTVMTSPRPPILYDYYGFPPESYAIEWPAPGSPELAARVRALLDAAGIPSAEDAERGFDHGTFIPLKLTFPDADIPAIQLSIEAGYDPARHLAIGRALAPLRDEGVLIVGSGMSYHNMRMFRAARPLVAASSAPFDAWLHDVVAAEPADRDARLARWSAAPGARDAQPHEDHLMPLHVIAGAAGADRGRVTYSDVFLGAHVTGARFGA